MTVAEPLLYDEYKFQEREFNTVYGNRVDRGGVAAV